MSEEILASSKFLKKGYFMSVLVGPQSVPETGGLPFRTSEVAAPKKTDFPIRGDEGDDVFISGPAKDGSGSKEALLSLVTPPLFRPAASSLETSPETRVAAKKLPAGSRRPRHQQDLRSYKVGRIIRSFGGVWNINRTESPFQRKQLTGKQVQGLHERGVWNFAGANLSMADLREAILREEVILRGADLRAADLRGADLTGAHLEGADLTGANLTGAILTGAILRGANLRGALLKMADLEGADFTGAIVDKDTQLPFSFAVDPKNGVVRED